jgi:hypothetical protein
METLAKTPKQTPQTPQPELWQDTRPRILEATGPGLFTAIALVNMQGGRVESVTFDRKRGNAAWTLRVQWSDTKSFNRNTDER